MEGASLEDARKAVLGDLGLSIPEVSVDFMVDRILLPVHCNFDTVKTKLQDAGHILGGRWAAFDKDPTDSTSNENNSFKALQGIFTEIIHHAKGEISNGDNDDEAGGSESHRTLTYHNNPNQTPYFKRHSGAHPDGYFMRPSTGLYGKRRGRSNTTTVHDWDDITGPAEFKKHNSAADVADVSFSLTHKFQFSYTHYAEHTEDILEHPPYHA